MPYVYCLSNPAMPDLIKIGAVHIKNKSVKERAEELCTTGVPEEFCIEFFAEVLDSRKTEREIHDILDEYRNKSQREFFRLTPEAAKTIIEQNIPEIRWSDKDSVSTPHVSKSTYKRLKDLYTLVSDNAVKFVNMMKSHEYYESSSYDSINENACRMFLQRLGYIRDGLERMNSKEGAESPYTKIDNAYMKKELNTIQTDLERFKESYIKH